VTRKRNLVTETNGRREARASKRVQGTNGSWPAIRAKLGKGNRGGRVAKNTAAPGPPAICFLYPDLNDPAENDVEPVPVFGQYPAIFIDKILPWLRCRASEVLHVCSGSLPRGTGIRVDIRPSAAPDVVADGRALPFKAGSVAAVMLDPPYSEHYAAELYGTSYPRPAHLLAEAARVVRPSGRIVFVHYITPNPPPGCLYLKCFGLSTGMGFPMRAVTIFEKGQAELLLAEAAS
jgi:SAM-dependent methyltransferase